MLVDCFGYRVTKDETGYLISSSDELFMKSISLGFIRTQMQRQNVLLRYHEQLSKAPSILEDAERMYDKYQDTLFRLEKEPVERFVFVLPGIEPLKILADPDVLWREEFFELAEIHNDIFLTIENLKEFKVRGEVTLFDVLKVKRIFSFIAFSFNNYLKSKLDTEPKLVFRSLIPLFRSANLKTILSAVINDDKIEDWLELMSWSKNRSKVLDLQYTPLIQVEDYYFFLNNLLAASNIVRNSLYLEQVRVFDDGTFDPLSIRLESALKSAGFDTITGLKIKYDNLSTDIDVLARQGNNLFFFESKNSLLPSNVAELRTSLDYIYKASSQLSNVVNRLSDKNFVHYLCSKAGWEDCTSISTCRTCIVFGNRTFYGYRHNGHPIVPVQELVNYIESGEMILQGKPELVRPKGSCTPDMLCKFLDNSPFIKSNIESLTQVESTSTYQKKRVIVRSYALKEIDLSMKLTECVRDFAASF